jgi:hypothetical protein
MTVRVALTLPVRMLMRMCGRARRGLCRRRFAALLSQLLPRGDPVVVFLAAALYLRYEAIR